MLDSVIQYMNDFERKPTSNQSTTLQRLWNTSSGKKKWEEYVTQQETLDLSRQMTNKFKSQSQSKHVNHVPAEIRRYGDGGEIERKPIGFKTKSTLTESYNRYTMDTSIENIKKTKLERFDALFNE